MWKNTEFTASVRRDGKLGANWEGPFNVIKVLAPGTYQLGNINEKILPHSWNLQLLRAYYQ